MPSTPFNGSAVAAFAPTTHAIGDLARKTVAMFLSRRFATFVLFGGLAALVNLIVGRMLYTLPHFTAVVPYWLAVAIGTATGTLVNFGLNYALNFRYAGRSAAAQLRTFIVVSIGGVLLTALVAQGVSWLMERVLGAGVLSAGGFSIDVGFAAHITAIGVTMFYSFTAHSAFSFNVGLRRRIARAFGRDLEHC